jgi:hypothetical protein
MDNIRTTFIPTDQNTECKHESNEVPGKWSFWFAIEKLTACSLGLSATSQQYFSLRTNQPSATSQHYFSLRTNQHQPSATSQTNMFLEFMDFRPKFDRMWCTSRCAGAALTAAELHCTALPRLDI